ncbi:flavin monoamine oxidase family protein [Halofilum ochraceum]|uniref:flavin monoamine oxidase family protein n=1 Tax=Halofilum ochraceum TaxID=1611323 RepID=UPI0009F6F486|nr:NAD(P)/FAD-dependent oxidoreductase [Halofilum ochraceum]
MASRKSCTRITEWSRRDFLRTFGVGSAALMVPAPLIASAEPDVVIVGAGAAGVAAARALMDQGYTVRIVEAADRVGGRAFTEQETFDFPFDHGASWLSSANANPHRRFAQRYGFDLNDFTDATDTLFVGDREAEDGEYQQYWQAYNLINDHIRFAYEAGNDVPASTVVPEVPFGGTAQTWIGPMDLGVDFRDMSTIDYWSGADAAPTYHVAQGYGALVARLARDLPVELETPVSGIEWGGKGVRVRSSRGTLKARACIVTASTGVLDAERIRFDPALPDWKLDAIHDLPMGLLAKVALEFTDTRFGLPENSWLTYKVPEEVPTEACFFSCWPSGSDLMVGFVGGEFGWELSRAGREDAIDFALGELRKRFGSDVDRHFVKGTFTEWAENPLTMGAYSAARPGRASAREDIVTPIADRVFFAGEACAGAYVATCGGAHMSGQVAAEQVADALG